MKWIDFPAAHVGTWPAGPSPSFDFAIAVAVPGPAAMNSAAAAVLAVVSLAMRFLSFTVPLPVRRFRLLPVLHSEPSIPAGTAGLRNQVY